MSSCTAPRHRWAIRSSSTVSSAPSGRTAKLAPVCLARRRRISGISMRRRASPASSRPPCASGTRKSRRSPILPRPTRISTWPTARFASSASFNPGRARTCRAARASVPSAWAAPTFTSCSKNHRCRPAAPLPRGCRSCPSRPNPTRLSMRRRRRSPRILPGIPEPSCAMSPSPWHRGARAAKAGGRWSPDRPRKLRKNWPPSLHAPFARKRATLRRWCSCSPDRVRNIPAWARTSIAASRPIAAGSTAARTSCSTRLSVTFATCSTAHRTLARMRRIRSVPRSTPSPRCS